MLSSFEPVENKNQQAVNTSKNSKLKSLGGTGKCLLYDSKREQAKLILTQVPSTFSKYSTAPSSNEVTKPSTP